MNQESGIRSSLDTESVGILEFPLSTTVRNKFLSFIDHSVHWSLLQ
jgi:hypothetical protein